MTASSPSRPLIARPEAWLLFILFLGILLGHREQIERDANLAMDETRGYRAAANTLVERGCLQLADLPDGDGRLFIEPQTGADCPSQEVFDSYRRRSPLGGDMASLVGQRWVIEQSATGPKLRSIRANAHPLRFANDVRLAWKGSVFYAGGAKQSGNANDPATWLWVNGDDVLSRQPRCVDRLVDGSPPDGEMLLHQYLQCKSGTWQAVEPIRALSETTGSARRVRDPALASVLRRLEVRDIEGDFRTTIKRPLQRATQAQLERHLDKADTSNKRERTVRAGVLLMDGLTGEIAAAATYPVSEKHVRDSRGDAWRERNWNFERLPVGSTAKVPFAAAIVQADRQLVRPSPSAATIASGYCAEGAPGRSCRSLARSRVGIGFTDFITVSSNGHALWLLYQARLSEETEWMENLRKFACIEPLDGDGDPTCSGYLWRSDKPGRGLQTRGISEPLLRLDLDERRGESLFSSVYLTILGANRSSWTSANLAQSYARIFSNTAVNPRLTEHDAPQIPALGVDLQVWTLIRDGMAGVVGKANGTGRALCGAIGCTGNRIGNVWLYAKTGTSTIADVAPADDGRFGDNGKVLVLLAAKTADGSEPRRPSDITDLKVMVITQRYSSPGKDALDLAIALFSERRFRSWAGLDAPAGPVGAGR